MMPGMSDIVTLQRQSVRTWFAWLLPTWFVFGAVLATIWPGHEWQLFAIGALPGVWLSFLIDADGGMSWLLPTLLAGAPLLWLLGHLLDRLETDLTLWFGAALLGSAVAGYVLLQSYSDLDEAVAYHGSFAAFCVCAMQLGGYGATLLLLAIGANRSG